jgi:CheY-like chemotaxis protein
VGTVEKRGLFFHGFHSPDFCLAVSFPQSRLFNRQPVFVDDGKARDPPNMLLSDIGMTGENGYDLIREIRALPPEKGGNIPAVAPTAYAGSLDRRRALIAGFHVQLAKPVEPDELLAVIGSLGRTTTTANHGIHHS